MSSSEELFRWASESLAERTAMSLPQSRGTVRLALKQVGLQPEQLSVAGLEVVLSRVMPRELKVRGFNEADLMCRELIARLRAADFDDSEDPESTADSVLSRIFGSG